MQALLGLFGVNNHCLFKFWFDSGAMFLVKPNKANLDNLFFRAWNKVVSGFNKVSGRPTPSTRMQLLKLASSLRSEERSKSDAQHEVALKKFRQSCAQTGAGDGEKMPPGKMKLKTCLYKWSD